MVMQKIGMSREKCLGEEVTFDLTNALSRYLETAALVYSWYLDDCWDEESVASKMIRRVNSMHRWMFCVLFSLLSHHDRYIAEKVRPIGSSELSQSVSKVFKEANIDCEKEMTEQVTEERADDADIYFYFIFRIGSCSVILLT